MSQFPLKPSSAYVKAYYKALQEFHQHGYKTEGNIRSVFSDLLKRCASPYDWKLVEEYQFRGTNKQPLRADGALVDELTLVHGLWEAKDTADDLEKEVRAKVAKGYPLTNIIFQSPNRAILYQDNLRTLDCDLNKPENLVEVLQLFFTHRQPHETDWEEAVLKFSEKIPDLAEGATKILKDEYRKNNDFRQKFQAFADLCRESINPDLTDDAIQKMLVQHLLTERIFRKVFNNPEFLTRNVIAAEIEKVIRSITSRHFSRDTFLQELDHFYKAIETAAEQQQDYTEKQHFLNAVYEKFFQSFDKKQADTHGIVYTPQPIVDFMVRSVEEVLKSEFGKSLSDQGVHILDPFTGTGNFITRIMRQIKKSRLTQKYAEELHCNEVMLLPYYIASMNIEHAYLEAMGEYRSFEGICLVDTFETKRQAVAFAEENSRRIAKQNNNRIFVVIGNPPYNAWQHNEDENNKNRKYPVLDQLIIGNYVRPSRAVNKNALWDMYVRAFRWASDRIGEDGVIAFVSNNGFLDGLAFDGMRKSLAETFSDIYHFDLKGNARTSGARRQREGGNIFNDAIRVGVGITILVKKTAVNKAPARIHLFRIADHLDRAEKERVIGEMENISKVPWDVLNPERGSDWFEYPHPDRDGYCNIACSRSTPDGIFALHSNAVKTNRDAWVYNFHTEALTANVKRTIGFYNSEAERWASRPEGELDSFVKYDTESISWSRDLKQDMANGTGLTFSPSNIIESAYRPFCKLRLYFDPVLNEEIYSLPKFRSPRDANIFITLTGPASEKPFLIMATDCLPDLHIVGAASTGQTFPFYTYDEDGSHRRENITDWALDQYRAHYQSKSITKWDIFHSTYALLHHPEYRTRYAANLKRELPRIPFPPNFCAFADAGKRLMELHVNYEQQKEYPLEEIETPKAPFTLRVEKMSLNKDKTELRYNQALTLRGIPPAAFDYRLGNRSALEWIIDQYRVSTDTRSGITNDPNRPDDERYILRLIGQVITVSLETTKIVNSLPTLNLDKQIH